MVNLYIVSFIISNIIIYQFYRIRRSAVGALLFVMGILTSFWILMELLSSVIDDKSIIISLQLIKYGAIVMISPLLLWLSYGLIWALNPKKYKLLSLFFIVPIISCLSIATDGFPYVFISGMDVEWIKGIAVFLYERELGFYIHTAYSYLVIIMTNILLLYRTLKAPRIFKVQSRLIFAGSIVPMILNVLFLSGHLTDLLIDTTPLSILLTLTIFYGAIYVLPKKELVPKARNLVIENMSDLVVITDNHDCIIDVNPAAQKLLVKGSSLLLDRNPKHVDFRGMPFERLVKSMPIVEHGLINEESLNYRSITIELEAVQYFYQVNVEPIVDGDDREIGMLYILYDITQIKTHVAELTTLNNSLMISDSIINEALEGIIITDADNRIIRANKSQEVMSGYTMEELIGEKPSVFKSERHDYGFYKDMWDNIKSDGFWKGEIWDRRKNGEVYPKWMSITVIKNNKQEIDHFIGISSDLSRVKEAEKDIKHMAYYDSLTGLPNRALFNDRLKSALRRCERHDSEIALLYMDLDRFKLVNDTYGHFIGDELLIAVARRIESQIRKTDILCRLAGDEFTLILEDIDSPSGAGIVAQKIIDAFEEIFIIKHYKLSIMISIGIAIAPNDDEQSEGLIRKADVAMYQAKKIGGSHFVFSSVEIEQENKELNLLELNLREAIKNESFELFLQPQITFVEGAYKLIGAEALIRWSRDDGQRISPSKFISVAEKSGLMMQIGLWVLEEIFRLNDYLCEKSICIPLAINVSIRQFDTNEFYEHLKLMMHSPKTHPIDLTIEITESIFFNDLDKGINLLNKIKALGVKIALDDFGTGFSSMSYLNKLPIDYLKIDKSFIDQLEGNNKKNLAYMILSMAKTLDLNTIAEGVETEMQSAAMFEAGCDAIQGYYFSKPLSLDDFIKYFNDKRRTD
jgi:diguanylate cyclase (GGDEF)-like protein/PAS domain S-box-containing protein